MYVSMLLLTDIWVVFRFGAIMKNILVLAFWWTYVLISVGIYWGVELPGHWVDICLALVDTAKQLSNSLVPSYPHTSGIWALPSLSPSQRGRDRAAHSSTKLLLCSPRFDLLASLQLLTKQVSCSPRHFHFLFPVPGPFSDSLLSLTAVSAFPDHSTSKHRDSHSHSSASLGNTHHYVKLYHLFIFYLCISCLPD